MSTSINEDERLEDCKSSLTITLLEISSLRSSEFPNPVCDHYDFLWRPWSDPVWVIRDSRSCWDSIVIEKSGIQRKEKEETDKITMSDSRSSPSYKRGLL